MQFVVALYFYTSTFIFYAFCSYKHLIKVRKKKQVKKEINLPTGLFHSQSLPIFLAKYALNLNTYQHMS